MAPTVPPFDPANVQGDILLGLPKKVQHYVLFQIDDKNVRGFRQRLKLLVTHITSTVQVAQDHSFIAAHKLVAKRQGKTPELLTLSGINIAFSHTGLVKLGITDNTGDTAFEGGQLKDAENLGDPGSDVNGQFVPDWVPAFKNGVDGVILISGDSELTVAASHALVASIFNLGALNATFHEVLTLKGNVRPGADVHREHFGFLDGISQPAVKGFDTKPNPGQETVRQGVILCGRENDIDLRDPNTLINRPEWALDGSFLVLRYLFQLVPEFNTFLKDNPIVLPGLTREQGSELLGARLVGRWKSGAPIDLFPLKDNPTAGGDPKQNNNFQYDANGGLQTQDRCPFAAHTRKTNPRADLEKLNPPISTENRRILRRGIQFGPEVGSDEATSGKTKQGRGLIFVAYQSNIVNGFQFIQKRWANAKDFPPFKENAKLPGFDPIIGQTGRDQGPRTLVGVDPKNQNASSVLPMEWVVPKGGEYFFSPSIPALLNRFAL